MNRTPIEYLDFTWNPIAMRCTPVSEACDNCWHLDRARMLANNPNISPVARQAYAGGPPVLLEDRLGAPLRRRKPARIGVQFMGDLGHKDSAISAKDIEWAWIDKILTAVALCPEHTFLILTKRPETFWYYMAHGRPTKEYVTRRYYWIRPEIVAAYSRPKYIPMTVEWPLPNLWLGVTAENQRTADERIPILLQIPAAVHYVSFEPLLSPIHVNRCWTCKGPDIENCDKCEQPFYDSLKWIVLGGETGRKARPMHPDWPMKVRDHCRDNGVPFFFKGWGEWGKANSKSPGTTGHYAIMDKEGPRITNLREYPRAFWSYGGAIMERIGKTAAGRMLDGQLWEELPG